MDRPPFTISAKAINLIAKISSQLERYAIRMEQEDTCSTYLFFRIFDTCLAYSKRR